jgi:hypothetical protein
MRVALAVVFVLVVGFVALSKSDSGILDDMDLDFEMPSFGRPVMHR